MSPPISDDAKLQVDTQQPDSRNAQVDSGDSVKSKLSSNQTNKQPHYIPLNRLKRIRRVYGTESVEYQSKLKYAKPNDLLLLTSEFQFAPPEVIQSIDNQIEYSNFNPPRSPIYDNFNLFSPYLYDESSKNDRRNKHSLSPRSPKKPNSDWGRTRSENGEIYFFNRKTWQTQWEEPTPDQGTYEKNDEIVDFGPRREIPVITLD